MTKNRTIKDWVIATRPWALPASVTPIIAITAYLFYLSRQAPETLCDAATTADWLNALLSLLLLTLLHSGGNLVSDYYDHTSGVDKPSAVNGVTWIYDGTFQPKEILHFGYALISVAAAIGVVLLLRSSLDALWLGAAALVIALGYSWSKGHAVSDLWVLLGFALLPAVGVSYVVSGAWHWETMLLSLSYGLLTVAILHSNNTRDIESDSEAGLTTMAAFVGRRASQCIYLAEMVLPYVLAVAYFALGIAPAWVFLVMLTLPLAIKNAMAMLPPDGSEPQIRMLDQRSAQLQMAFGLLLTLSFIIGAYV